MAPPSGKDPRIVEAIVFSGTFQLIEAIRIGVLRESSYGRVNVPFVVADLRIQVIITIFKQTWVAKQNASQVIYSIREAARDDLG
jgi:hypothetical protein